MKHKVRIKMVRWVDVVVECDSDDRIDIEDAGAEEYYRGRVTFPEGSPALVVEVLESPSNG